MMRVAGRDYESERPKAISTDSEGRLKTISNENNAHREFNNVSVNTNTTHILFEDLNIGEYNAFTLALATRFNHSSWNYGSIKIRVVSSVREGDYGGRYKVFDNVYKLSDFTKTETIDGERPSFLIHDNLPGKYVKVEIINDAVGDITFAGVHFRAERAISPTKETSNILINSNRVVVAPGSTATIAQDVDVRNTNAFILSAFPQLSTDGWIDGLVKIKISTISSLGSYSEFFKVHDKVYSISDFEKVQTSENELPNYILQDKLIGSFMRVQVINESTHSESLTFGNISIERIESYGGSGGSSTFAGELTAKDENEVSHPLTAELDDSGKAALRVVDAAPFAYDPVTDRYKVETESKTKKGSFVETVANSPVPPNQPITIDVQFEGESEVWLMVSFSQNEWDLRSGAIFRPTSPSYDSTFFPSLKNVRRSHGTSTPTVSLFLPTSPSSSMGLTAPTSLNEAREHLLSPGNQVYRFRFTNQSAEAGDLKIDVVRVYK